MKPLYIAEALAIGGRMGTAASTDGRLRVDLSAQKALGGAGGDGTNPEQLFAAGYAACFLSAIKLIAGREKIAIPDAATVGAVVGIGFADEGIGFGLSVTLRIELPGIPKDIATELAQLAHEVCPYSNATRGNVDVAIEVE